MTRITFYITNHGYGHASRNIPIIIRLLEKNPDLYVDVKTDAIRCGFIKRNLENYANRIKYYDDCTEVGFILKKGTLIPDVSQMQYEIERDQARWGTYFQRETEYLRKERPQLVVADVVSWAIRAASQMRIKSLLIGNFTWDQMYRYFLDEKYWMPYYENYKMAERAIWYEPHASVLDGYCAHTQQCSMVTRKIDDKMVKAIKSQCSLPIVFVSYGGSMELTQEVNVEHLPYVFFITKGVRLAGCNVHCLPSDMINTPDYIAAADYIIAKGGWSTVAEILLQRKKCALIFRRDNPEDNITKGILEQRGHCIQIQEEELIDIGSIIKKIDRLVPENYDMYYDSTEKISNIIMEMAGGGNAI